jgi:uncharacterized LabA/DUF88 family protein
MIETKHQRVGVLIDVQNMYYSARNLFDRKVNFGNVVKKIVGDRQLIRAIAYVVSTKTGENKPFFDALVGMGIETKEKELKEYFGGAKKADWDVGITVDAISLSESLDVIVVVSGDGDYIPLVNYLRHKGKIVEVASFRETTSTQLVEAVGKGRYINLSDNKRSFLMSERTNSDRSTRSTKVSVPTTTLQPSPIIKTSTSNLTSRKPSSNSTRKTTSSRTASRKPSSSNSLPSRKKTAFKTPPPEEFVAKPVSDGDLSSNEEALNN